MKEFEAIAARGGGFSAMETGYQRGKIRKESRYCEHKKHDGAYPIIGVHKRRPFFPYAVIVGPATVSAGASP